MSCGGKDAYIGMQRKLNLFAPRPILFQVLISSAKCTVQKNWSLFLVQSHVLLACVKSTCIDEYLGTDASSLFLKDCRVCIVVDKDINCLDVHVLPLSKIVMLGS